MQLEWVLRVFPLGGVGCIILLLLLAVMGKRHGSEPIAQEAPVLTIIFRDCGDGVEGLLRWLLLQKWWRERPGTLLIGLECEEQSSREEILAILSRLQQQSQSLELLPAEEYFCQLKRSDQVIIIGKDSGIPWERLKEILREPASQTA